MNYRNQLSRLSEGLTAQERAILVLQAFKEARSKTGVAADDALNPSTPGSAGTSNWSTLATNSSVTASA